jgi:6-phosphofructokinase 1
MNALFEEEGQNLFEVRQAILGHLQQGGSPTPFDRIQATRLATKCIDFLIQEADKVAPMAGFMGRNGGQTSVFSIEDLPRMMDTHYERPSYQWWMEMVPPIARTMARPAPVDEDE